MEQPQYPEAREKAQMGFLDKFRNRFLEITSKDIFQRGWNAAIKHFTPRLFQARSTARLVIEEYSTTKELSKDTLGMLGLIASDVVDFEKNTTDCFDEMEGALRKIRGIFEKEESDSAKMVVRLCDNGLWRIENGKYRNK
jgi:hypothetical protein